MSRLSKKLGRIMHKSDALPGPMSGDAEAGWNFNHIGVDYDGIQPAPSQDGPNYLPHGADETYETGEDRRGLASVDGFPRGGGIGVASNDGLPDHDGDLASSAGYRVVRSFEDMYGRQPISPERAPYGEQDTDFSGPL